MTALPSSVPPGPTPPPGLYFGWVIVAASTVLTLLTVGMRMGIGPFMLPMSEDLGFSRSLLSSIVAVGMLCYGLGMPAAGWLVARKGTRTVLLTGTAIVVLACLWTVNARTPWSFFWAYGVALSLGLAFTSPVAVTPMISRWFTRQRGMALFFLSTGSMAGIAVMTPVFTTTIGLWGWQRTLLGFAVVFALIIGAMALWIVRDEAPENTDLTATQIEQKRQSKLTHQSPAATESEAISFTRAIATAPFWQIFLGLFACGFSMNLLGTHGMPMLMDHGFDAGSSAGGIGLIGFVAIFSTLALGKLSDMVPRRYILAVIYLVRGLGFVGLVAVVHHWQLYAVAAIGGIVWAGSIAASSAILGDLYGIQLVGLLYGWAYLGHQIGAMISSWLGGWAFEQFGTHWIAFGAAAMLLLVAACVSLLLPSKLKP
ncbi:MFS family permease [Comamonas odontotermitis]|uniref:MFS family permease n=1 Tax=Comamonas odontotermitis TaxID=379895 RepID=A0ABR6RCI7_9BURK|nr:MFS transporter [Comamonas odontotermitis]MBB6576874.1 MFS family permease [Comamonas odontotermitis]